MNIGDKAPEILGKDEQGRDIRLRIRRGDYLQQVYGYLGKGEAVVLTGHRRAEKTHGGAGVFGVR